MNNHKELIEAINEARAEGKALGWSLPGMYRTQRLIDAIAAREAELSHPCEMADSMGDE